MANEKCNDQLSLELPEQASEPKKKCESPASVKAAVVPIANRQAEKRRSEEAKYVSELLSLAKHLK